MFRTLLATLAVGLSLIGTAWAQAGVTPAFLSVVDGAATLERDGETVPAVQNMPFVQGDRLRTAAGRVQIAFPDGSAIEVDEYSEVECVSPTRVRLLAGTMDHVQRDMTRSASASYLPPELDTYGTTLDQNGAWQYEAPYGYVWYPTVATDWRPYYQGYWAPVPSYGWTWIGVDPWAWPTHHYGRWGYASNRWFWIPGRTWGPAWVSWASANDYVSWCPLGFDSRPVFALSVGSRNAWAGWTVLPRTNFGAHGYYAHRYAVDARRIPSTTTFIAHTTPPLAYGRTPRQQTVNGRIAAGGGSAVPRQAPGVSPPQRQHPAASRQVPVTPPAAASDQQTIDPRWSRNPQGVQTHYGVAMPRPTPNQPAGGAPAAAPATQPAAAPQSGPAAPGYRVPNGYRIQRMDPRVTAPAPTQPPAPPAPSGGTAVPRTAPPARTQPAAAPAAAAGARTAPAAQPAQGQAQPRGEGQAAGTRRPR